MKANALAACCTLGCLIVSSNGLAQPAHVRVVDGGAAPGGNGQMWATAYQHPQEALDDAAQAGGAVTEIWVVAGEYAPTKRTIPADPGSVTFLMVDNVSLYGGFAGGEQNRGERDPAVNVTVLAGVIEPNTVAAYHVVTAVGPQGVILDGFTITGGDAQLAEPPAAADGAGLRLIDSDLMVVDCIIRENRAIEVAGMFISGGAPTIVSSRLVKNEAWWAGAGITMVGSEATFTDCVFEANAGISALHGPVFVSIGGDIAVSNCKFIDHEGDEIICVRIPSGTAFFTDCLFENNTVGFVVEGGTYIRSIFRNNTAAYVVQDATLSRFREYP